jgi:phosphomannomutase
MTKIIIKMAQMGKEGKTLDSLISALRDPAEECELRFKIRCDDFRNYGNEVISKLEEYAKCQNDMRIADDNREGIRIYFDSDDMQGLLLLRLSVHDPIMPLNIESDTVGGVLRIAERFLDFCSKCEKLDISPLVNFLK